MREVAPHVLAMIGQHDDYLIPLNRIVCETLFLWTEDNPVHDIETARGTAEQVIGSKLYVMKNDAAHWPQYEASDEFNEIARKFFSPNGLMQDAQAGKLCSVRDAVFAQ